MTIHLTLAMLKDGGHSPPLEITVPKEIGQPAKTFIPMNAKKMFARVRGSAGAHWLCCQGAVWDMYGFLKNCPHLGEYCYSLLGYPFYVSGDTEFGTKGDVILRCEDGDVLLQTRA